MTDHHQQDIDQKLADDIDKELEEELGAILQSKTTAQLEKVCANHENLLRETFQRQIEAFKKHKQLILTTMSRAATKRGAPNAVQPRLFEHMEPESFQFLQRHFTITNSRAPSPTTGPLSPATSATPSLQCDENVTKANSPSKSGADNNNNNNGSSRRVHTAKRSGAQPNFSAPTKKQKTALPDINTATRSDMTAGGRQPTPSSVPQSPVTAATPTFKPASLPSPSARRDSQASFVAYSDSGIANSGGTRTTTTHRNKNLLTTEVEGTDFVFKYPDYGSGWFVIRCPATDTNGNKCPVSFREHPLSSPDPELPSAGNRHFNEDIHCSGHKTKKGGFTNGEIMDRFGHEVFGPRGARVDESWVTASNEKLKSKSSGHKGSSSKSSSSGSKGGHPITNWGP
ncbi:hypothetical protein QBC44DRAFT_565 [Cladorrhinum sp. PSN332]|nr:hypothetical protein QBC44DRAFT_565 [Cladorrhinum sp. PSN332]